MVMIRIAKMRRNMRPIDLLFVIDNSKVSQA